jgi:UrcA family protein
MLKALPALAALTATIALVTPTVSRAEEPISVRVSYADLNLTTDPGRQMLQRRIVFAARTVCGTSDPLNLAFAIAVAECRDGAIADAQPAFDAAVAAARHPSVTVLDASALVVTMH